ncbi:hypothetical protein CTI12_AA063030 [Artemisia annua]|uniref:Uncharacterized protein n=1 Tax=Artemisia annua TaxID=35608 RepID=A0A2U1PL12_ARTAN|nr:hypothetical protein CTI12_AA063030 [Artemisia annua]
MLFSPRPSKQIMEAPPSTLSIKDVFPESIYPLDSRILLVPLNEEESQSWLKLKDIASSHGALFKMSEMDDELREVSIELDHPFVPVLSDFAISAYNELCRMYVKKDEEDNVYEAEVINVKYSPNSYGYLFSITIEAMEEDVAGVYEATVLCNSDDGKRTLIKFILSPRAPSGKKFKGMSDLIRDKLVYQLVKEQRKDIKGQLMEAKKRSKRSSKLNRLKNDYKVVKGAFRVFKKYAYRLKPISWKIKKTYWWAPNKLTGLQARDADHSCGGYDYQNPLTVFSCYT